jgi:hypothetical protein
MGDVMSRRRRVSLLESFKLAGRAGLKAPDSTAGDASLIATIVFGIWWWVAGVPLDEEDKRD